MNDTPLPQLSDDVGIRLRLPDKPVYVGQRVPIEIEWRYGGRARNIRRDEAGFFRTEDQSKYFVPSRTALLGPQAVEQLRPCPSGAPGSLSTSVGPASAIPVYRVVCLLSAG